MFGLGFGEMVVIVILAILVVGPERLPTLLKTVGGAMRQMRQASRDIRSTVGLDELMSLDEPPAKRPVARVKPPQDGAPVAHGDPVAHAATAAPAPPTAKPATPSVSREPDPTSNH
jgi:sec-independent protein translocase protein TatB